MKVYLIIFALIITSCTNIEEYHGSPIKPKVVRQIEPNVTKAQVTGLLGSPSTTSSYGEEIWYYIANNKNQNIFSDDDMVEQEVLAIYFNEDDKVFNVESYGLRDAQEVELSSRKTSTAGHDLTVMEQLLGNVGRFVPSGLTGGRGANPSGQ